MRKLIMPALGAALVLAGVWSIGGTTPPDVDPVISGSIPRDAGSAAGKAFSVANIETKADCVLTRGERMTHHSMRMTASDACDAVWSGLSHASSWTEAGDGTVVLTDAAGDAILTLAETDGLYEVIDPSGAIITLRAAE
ncbi:AprI/Inh family metalloprotease inhibitor [Rhizobium sp. TRM96647]|uniref:AprI/Inh family metalloprotease inhibitor n=1 Tax=unclassified Rhizobium TaxID=2613769 RepID=UPI0021E8303D|nr:MULTISPECIES: AprI/Inh family metalloprotease inhibitor [unclassified Rhizobium]MCV3735992.1 AprI/Inh family metalloprotease inhibitor [Rhizobium sp. TRM96647]MCV3758346.1 AprI/Inh family metalloprotease inhibitor [Rhizobium sp. TRM96650]